MTTMSAPYAPVNPFPARTADPATTVPLARPVRPVADRRGLVLDPTRLWTGGLATAAVAALTALVGSLVVRVLLTWLPVGAAAARSVDGRGAALLCLVAAVAALAATGLAHLLLVSTPEPLSYLGWIVGLCTAVAVVLPLLGTAPWAAAVAAALVHLVIGLAIGSLVVDAAGAAYRPATR